MDSTLIAPIINLGAVGVCLTALSIYYLKKDKKYEGRIDEMLSQERGFRKEKSDLEDKYRKEILELSEKYRGALEKFGQALDSVMRVMRKPGGD